METQLSTGNAAVSANLAELLDLLTVDQLFSLRTEMSEMYYAFSDKPAVFELSGVSRVSGKYIIHYTDSILGIDHLEFPVDKLSSKMKYELTAVIIKMI